MTALYIVAGFTAWLAAGIAVAQLFRFCKDEDELPDDNLINARLRHESEATQRAANREARASARSQPLTIVNSQPTEEYARVRRRRRCACESDAGTPR